MMSIKEILQRKNYALLKSTLNDYSVMDVVDLLSKFPPAEQAVILRHIKLEKAATIFSYLSDDTQKKLVKYFNQKEIVQFLQNMYADDSADFIANMPSPVAETLLKHLDEGTRRDVTRLLNFEKESVGAIMTVEFIALTQEMTVEEAFAHIRACAIDSETIYTCYVVEEKKLIGIVSVKDMIMVPYATKIADIMQRKYVFLKVDDNKETAAQLFNKYGLLALPVVDDQGVLVGIVTFDDGFNVMQDEVTEDMQKMAGMTQSDYSYFGKSIWGHAKQRVVWLLILMVSASITGAIISRYEQAFTVVPLLVSFIPMLMDTGGNCGAQSSTLIIRGLTTDEFRFKDVLRVLWTEFRVSLLVSSILAVVNGINIFIRYHDARMAVVVSASLIGTIVVAKLIGALLPMLAHKVKLDPAIMAAPLITTVVDSCSILIYFKIASLLFGL